MAPVLFGLERDRHGGSLWLDLDRHLALPHRYVLDTSWDGQGLDSDKMPSMEKRLLGKTGLAVSSLGFGGAPVGFLDEDAQRTADILNPLLDAGVNLIDTAACYADSEPLIAEVVGQRRDEYILVTKCGHKVEGVRGEEWSAELIGLTVERALKRLKTDHIDIMLLHSCNLAVLKRGEAIGALLKAREAGKIRFVGYSGDNEAAAYATTLEDVAVIETSVNICDQANIDLVLPQTVEKNIGVLAKRALANAAWKYSSQQRGVYQSYARSYRKRLSAMSITPADLGFDGNPAQLWSRIALRFTLGQPGVHCTIAGTTNPENAQANLSAAAEGPLPADTLQEIRNAFQSAQAKTGKPWQGLT